MRNGRAIPRDVHWRWSKVGDKVPKRFQDWYLSVGNFQGRKRRDFSFSQNKLLPNMVPVVV
jgi:hypothetical protein